MAMCSDQGIWQPVNFECIFDPLAVNLKDGANYGKPQTSHWFVAQIENFSKVRLKVYVNLALKSKTIKRFLYNTSGELELDAQLHTHCFVPMYQVTQPPF